MGFSIKEIIKEYWDTEYFTEKELSEQGVCICERDFGDDNRVGIMVKKDNNLYHIVIRNGQNCLNNTYDFFPTIDNLINDFSK
jgi:hypothetical protein